jgi:hypothetical protein
MKPSALYGSIAVIGLTLALPIAVLGVCHLSSVSQADSDLWAVHGCVGRLFSLAIPGVQPEFQRLG